MAKQRMVSQPQEEEVMNEEMNDEEVEYNDESEEELAEAEQLDEQEEFVQRSASGRRRKMPLPQHAVQQRATEKKVEFTALLMNGATYEYMGMKFRRGVPRSVPRKYLKRFQSNGWFQLSDV